MSDVSLLFAVEASQLISAGVYPRAMELLLEGISEWPDYPAAGFLLLRLYQLTDRDDEAAGLLALLQEKYPALDLSLTNYPGCSLYPKLSAPSQKIQSTAEEHFLRKITGIDEYSSVPGSLRASNPHVLPGMDFIPPVHIPRHIPEFNARYLPDPPPFPGFLNIQASEPPRKEKPAWYLGINNPPVDKLSGDPFSELSSRLAGISMPGEDTPEVVPLQEETPEIVTETFARILVAQGAIGPAIEAYEKLIAQNPGNEEYYRGKIEELRKKP